MATHLTKLGEITGKTRVLYSELGEIIGKTRVLPDGQMAVDVVYTKISINATNHFYGATLRCITLVLFKEQNTLLRAL